jgi:hypothetical protein
VNTLPNTPTRVIFITAALLALSACGGGGGSEDTVVIPPPVDNECSNTNVNSLCQNPVPSTAKFENFEPATPSVPVPAIVTNNGFVGTRIFVKITGSDSPDPLTGAGQQVLFLGEVSPSDNFSIPVHVPLAETSLFYEVFSDSSSDDIVFGEFLL